MNISPDKSVGGFGPRTAPRRRLTRRHIGRVRVRLAELIAAQGYTVAPEDLMPQTGAWRTDHRLDVCRWESVAFVDGNGRRWMVQCWDTMSDCVRYGVTIERDGRNPSYLEVSANRPMPSSSVGAASSPGAAAANARGIRRTSAGKANR